MFSLSKFIPGIKSKVVNPLISNDYPDGTVIRVRKLDGVRMWYLNGLLNRDPNKGPAVENPDGTGRCYVNGKPHGEMWVDEIVPVVEEAKPAVVQEVKKLVPSSIYPKKDNRQSMSFAEFKLSQARNKAAEELHADEDEPTLADLSRLFKNPGSMKVRSIKNRR